MPADACSVFRRDLPAIGFFCANLRAGSGSLTVQCSPDDNDMEQGVKKGKSAVAGGVRVGLEYYPFDD